MYFRRKLLLALLELFGGELNGVDYHNLMFLYCQRTEHNYYDFFPYKYGACSFVLHQDKLRLTDLGYLEAGEQFRLSPGHKFKNQMDIFTQMAMQRLSQEVGQLRGNDLLRKVYLEYPYYATQSIIASKILTKRDYEGILQLRNEDCSPGLFTIGYEGITIDKYLDLLIENNISTLIDVRKNPISRKYGFSKSQLQRYTTNVGIRYFHFPELGIPSELRQNLNEETSYKILFEQYTNNMLPKQSDTIEKLRGIIFERGRAALTCFEADYKCCHRSKLAEHLQNDPSFKIPIVHL